MSREKKSSNHPISKTRTDNADMESKPLETTPVKEEEMEFAWDNKPEQNGAGNSNSTEIDNTSRNDEVSLSIEVPLPDWRSVRVQLRVIPRENKVGN